jgi:hypothetical protein
MEKQEIRNQMINTESVSEMFEMVKSANANGQMDIVQMIEKHIAIARPAEFNKAVIQQVEKEIGIWEYDEMDWE